MLGEYKIKANPAFDESVLIISSNYLPKIGGIESQLLLLAKYFAKKGFKVNMVTEQPINDLRDHIFFRIYRWTLFRELSFLKKIFYMSKFLCIIQKTRPVFILGRSISFLTLLPILFKRLGLIHNPYYIYIDTLNELIYINELRRPYKYLIKSFLLKNSYLISPSHFIIECFRSLDFQAKDIALIPNGVDFDSHHLESLPKKIPNSFVFLGTLNDNKNISEILKIFLKICITFKDVSLHIAGGGPLREVVEDSISRSGLSENIHYYGHIQPSENLAFLADKSYLIFASKVESFGLVAYEAAHCGLTLLARAVADIEIDLEEVSYFFNTDAELEELVISLIRGSLKAKGRNYYLNNRFSIQTVGDHIINLCAHEQQD